MNNNNSTLEFENVAFTKHARERLELRKISEDMIIEAIYQADRKFVQDNGNVKFIAKTMGCKVHAICKPLPDENKWLVISAWVRGEDDQGNMTDYKKINREYSWWSALSIIIGSAMLTIIIGLILWYLLFR